MSRTCVTRRSISRVGVLGFVLLAVLASVGVGTAAATPFKSTFAQPYPWSRTAAPTTGNYIADSYNGVGQDTPIENVTTDRLLDVLSSNGTYYILLAGPEHATGQAAVQQIDAEARADGIAKIYHFDPYVDGYQADVSDTTSGGVGSWTGGTSVNFGGTAKVSDVWKLITNLLPSSATTIGGPLYGYSGDQTLLLSVTISDRTNVQTGKVINASYKLAPADLPSFDATAARAAISNVFHQGPGGTVLAANERTQYQFFKRLYDSSASYTNSGTPSVTKIGGPVTIFSDSDYPNGGDGFPLVSVDIKDAYDLFNSPGEKAFLFAGQGCHNTQAIIGSVALRAKQLGLSKVYVVDFALDSNVKFGTGSLIDTTLNNSATGGLWVRNSATLAGAYKFSYLYGELANYFGPNWVTENSTKKNSSIAYYHNGNIQPSQLTSGGAWVVGNTNPNATRLQVPTVIAYNKDAVNPVTHTWLHRDSALSTSTPVYDEYMLELAWVRHTPLAVAATSTYVDGLTRTQFADEAVAALDNVLVPVQSYVASFSTSPAPTIAGTPKVGQTLSAQTGTWFPTPGTFSYQWNADGTAIPGATSSIYYVTSDVLGKQITVTVTADKAGFPSTAKTSSATDAVTSDFATTPIPTIAGIQEVGRHLSVVVGDWSPSPDLYTYQWYSSGNPIDGATGPTYLTTDADTCCPITVAVTAHKAFYTTTTVLSAETALLEPNSGPVAFTTAPTPAITGTATVGSTLTADPGTWAPTPDSLTFQWNADGTPIPGATTTTYVPTLDVAGKQITFTATATKADYATTSKTSTATPAVTGQFTVTPTPTIAGTPSLGETLTAVTGSWVATPDGFAYQWFADDVAIGGATGASYHLTTAELGKSISVQVTANRAFFPSVAEVSAHTATVTGDFTTAPTPTITGLFEVGRVLTANAGTWSPTPDSLTYQWFSGGSPIVGATTASYTTTSTDLGQAITVQVTAHKAFFNDANATSAPTPALQPNSGPTAFTLTPAPTISGPAAVGATLTAAPGTWTPTPASFDYQWFANGTAISGATGASYQLTGAELGKTITVQVTGNKATFASVSTTSAPTAAVAGPFKKVATPKITGKARVGKTLKAVAGAWSPKATFTYQWFADDVAIDGATASTYLVTDAVIGKHVSVTVTGTNAAKNTYGSASSAKTSAVIGFFSATPAPSILGTASVGATLTADAGAWSPVPDVVTYQWYANGKKIGGATGQIFVTTLAQKGKKITVKVTASKANYVSVTKGSAATVKVFLNPFVDAPTPSIAGTASVGSTLTVDAGVWNPAPDALTFQWFANGKKITGATNSTLVLAAAQKGKTITVKVTASKTNYLTVTKASVATAQVTL